MNKLNIIFILVQMISNIMILNVIKLGVTYVNTHKTVYSARPAINEYQKTNLCSGSVHVNEYHY